MPYEEDTEEDDLATADTSARLAFIVPCLMKVVNIFIGEGMTPWLIDVLACAASPDLGRLSIYCDETVFPREFLVESVAHDFKDALATSTIRKRVTRFTAPHMLSTKVLNAYCDIFPNLTHVTFHIHLGQESIISLGARGTSHLFNTPVTVVKLVLLSMTAGRAGARFPSGSKT